MLEYLNVERDLIFTILNSVLIYDKYGTKHNVFFLLFFYNAQKSWANKNSHLNTGDFS